MIRNIIALFVATLILFVWQALSWMVLPVHKDFSKYNPKDTAVMAVLNTTLTEPGAYMMPGMDPEQMQNKEAMEKYQKEHEGKPYALVIYSKVCPGMDGGQMLRGFLFNMIAILIAISMVNMAVKSGASGGKRFMVVLSMAVFCIVQGALLDWNWMNFPWHFIKGEVIDAIVGWSVVGLFLSWYLGRAQKA